MAVVVLEHGCTLYCSVEYPLQFPVGMIVALGLQAHLELGVSRKESDEAPLNVLARVVGRAQPFLELEPQSL